MVDAQRLAQFGADAHADGQRQTAEQGGHGGHHDGPEAQQAGLIDRLNRRQSLIALGLQRKVDHHDGVLLHDADQQNNADNADDAQVGSSQQQGENGSDAGRPATRRES